MKRRLTKQQKEVQEFQALRLRIRDITVGAAGYNIDIEGEFVTLDVASRLVRALEATFGNESNKYLFQPQNLDEYDNIDMITEFYFNHGVRA